MKKHIVCLDRQVREGLQQLARSGVRPAQVVRRCQILLESDSGCTAQEIPKRVGCTARNVRAVRKRPDLARFVRDLPKRYPYAERVHLVLDNLNTHNEKPLIETFGEEVARPMLDRLALHYTPKHASLLNMAEIETSAPQRQWLSRRLATHNAVQHEVSHCSPDRNRKKTRINWTFNRKDAKRVFPELFRY